MIRVYKLMRDNLGTIFELTDFKGYSIQWNSQNVEMSVEKGQKSEINQK